MYYQNYEDYMRNILGYPVQVSTLSSNTYNSYLGTEYEYSMQQPRYSREILDLYPEIYKIINPMVCKICEVNTKPITRELIEQMTDEIYLNIESDPAVENVVNVKVNLPDDNLEQRKGEKEDSRQNIGNKNSKLQSNINQSRDLSNNYSRNRYQENKKEVIESSTENKKVGQNGSNRESKNVELNENKQINRRRNNTLRDLIKILILNRLLGGNFRPHRPNPPRPPFPGGQRPNMPRPPIEPRYVYKNF